MTTTLLFPRSKFCLQRQVTSKIMAELVGLMQKESMPQWDILDSWRLTGSVVLLDITDSMMPSNKEPFLTSGYYTLPCVAWMDPLNPATIVGIWTAPGLRRQGLASVLLSLLEPELKFVEEGNRMSAFIHRICPALPFTCGEQEPVIKYETIEHGSLFTNVLSGKNTLPRNTKNCEVLAALLNEKFGTDYYHFQWLDRCERGIECIRSPDWGAQRDFSFKEVRFDNLGRADCDFVANEIRLHFKWKKARWSEWERQMVIACFMKVFAFTDLDPAFYKKQEIEALLATL